jgi:hypothetical protein
MGSERLIRKALEDEDITSDEENDFYYNRETFEFPTKEARDTATRMMAEATDHIGDYDSRKHTDVIWHSLSEQEYKRYVLEEYSQQVSEEEEEEEDEDKVVVITPSDSAAASLCKK